MIVNIKDFDSSLLEITKLWFKALFSNNIHYIKHVPTKSSNRVSIDRNDNDEDYIYLFLDDVDGHIEEINGIKYLIFFLQQKTRSIKSFCKTFGRNERKNCSNKWWLTN